MKSKKEILETLEYHQSEKHQKEIECSQQKIECIGFQTALKWVLENDN